MIYRNHKYKINLLVALWVLNLVSTSHSAACNFPDDPNVTIKIDEIASHPNNSTLALNNKYIAQKIGDIEVLKSWKLRYKGSTIPALSGATYKWERKVYGTEWDTAVEIGTTQTLEDDVQAQAGDFVIRFAATKDGYTCYSDTRRVKVIEITDNLFTLAQGGAYTKSGDEISFPAEGMTMRGKVSKKSGPETSKIKWGFIQGINSPNGNYVIVEHLPVEWNWLLAGTGSHANYAPKYVEKWQAGALWLNDSRVSNHLYLYGGSSEYSLGTEEDAYDTPGETLLISETVAYANSEGTATASCKYKLDASTYKVKWDFTVWLVVFNKETHQYVPLKQQDWSIDIDPSTAPTWYCTIPGSATNANTKPTGPEDGSAEGSHPAAYEDHILIDHPNEP